MSILDEILEVKKEEVRKMRQDYTYSRFSDSKYFEMNKLDFAGALSRKEKISIIAEIKKASPSKGIIKPDFDHRIIAEEYFKNDADAVSILTDLNFFKGSINYLRDIADFKDAPLLRKDFIIDEYQIFEAKSNGADAVLLIAEALSGLQINELSHAAKETDLDVLLELHSKDEINKIDFKTNRIIGINNRNLKTFDVNLESTFSISELLPDDVIIVSESGISNRDDIEKLKDCRTDAILVGEHFMKADSPGEELKMFTQWCRHEG